jgi:hypothetical protein
VDLDPRRVSAVGWATAVLAAAIGPLAAVAHQRGIIADGGLWSVAGVVLMAAVGAALGIRGVRRAPRWPGALALAANTPVLMFYGFLLAFFGLGGSR